MSAVTPTPTPTPTDLPIAPTFAKVFKRQFKYSELSKTQHRVVTVAYEHNPETNTFIYGAVIFKTTRKHGMKYDHSKHIETAWKRFNDSPVVVTNFEFGDHLSTFRKRVRKLLYKYGVKDHNDTNTNSVKQEQLFNDVPVPILKKSEFIGNNMPMGVPVQTTTTTSVC